MPVDSVWVERAPASLRDAASGIPAIRTASLEVGSHA